MNIKANFEATGIGSVPHLDAGKISAFILENFPEIPFWPQMPKLSFRENMYAQFSEKLPGLVVDEAAKKVFIDTSRDLTDDIEKLYERYLANDVEYFKISPEFAAGLYAFLGQLEKSKPKSAEPLGLKTEAPSRAESKVHSSIGLKPGDFCEGLKYLKGQVTGPISFGLTVADRDKRSIFYHPELSECVVKLLEMKIRWQVRLLKAIHPDILIFIDEPYMVSIGSSVVNIKKEEAASYLTDIIDAVHQEGALCGIHCCGNTDWGLLLTTSMDILNFDAYNFAGSLALYPEELKAFLNRGGVLAWGAVPTSSAVEGESAESLLDKLKGWIKLLTDKKIPKEKILTSSIITPSCGCGTLSQDTADRVLKLTLELSKLLKESSRKV